MMKLVRSWMQGVELPELETSKFDLRLFLDATLVYSFVVGSGREDAPALSPIKLSIAVVFVIPAELLVMLGVFTFQSEPFYF
jgi:hypothetical protein